MLANFIIFGTRGVNMTKDKGSMYCPRCGPNSNYKLINVRRFFTLYFIPLIPLDKLGEFVECQGCKGSYDPEILHYDPEKQQQEFEMAYFNAIIQILCEICLADGVVDDSEVKAISDAYKRLSGQSIGDSEIRKMIADAENNSRPIGIMIADFKADLNDAGKETFLEELYRVAAADGSIDKQELAIIEEVGVALEMSPAHRKGLMEEMKSKLGVS